VVPPWGRNFNLTMQFLPKDCGALPKVGGEFVSYSRLESSVQLAEEIGLALVKIRVFRAHAEAGKADVSQHYSLKSTIAEVEETLST
jgi:hypothetical protein